MQKAPQDRMAMLKRKVDERLKKIKHVIMILSGKGGVGKSFISANLAVAIASLGKRVGLLDADIHGPDVPKILGLEGEQMLTGPPGIFPVEGPLGVKVVSLEFLLPSPDVPIIWRGPLKTSAIIQLLGDVVWGDLDYLIIDLPPGTGDEPLTIAQNVSKVDGIILVTIPSEVSELDVSKAAGFARKVNIPILGIIENMSYFRCPSCGTIHYIFGKGSGERLAQMLTAELIGKIPLDPKISEANNSGRPFVLEYKDSEAAREMLSIAKRIIKKLEGGRGRG